VKAKKSELGSNVVSSMDSPLHPQIEGEYLNRMYRSRGATAAVFSQSCKLRLLQVIPSNLGSYLDTFMPAPGVCSNLELPWLPVTGYIHSEGPRCVTRSNRAYHDFIELSYVYSFLAAMP
jgi:hypothetical protein